jgi:hypothetical protein
MARKKRAQIEGGLYHVITGGNNRRQIFNALEDYEKFLLLLTVQKVKLPFESLRLLPDDQSRPSLDREKNGCDWSD